LLILATLLVCSSFGSEADVVVLTDANFDEIVNKEDLIIVEFYAPWCGHCKKLAPAWEEAAGTLIKNDPPVKLAKVDCTVETKVAGKYGISGYPTIKVFRKGTPSDYKGPRDAPGIVSYARKNAGPSAKPLNTAEEAKKFISNPSDINIVGIKGNSEFLKVADSLRDEFRFGVVSDKSLIDGLTDAVTIFRSEKDKIVFPGSGSLSDWIYEQSVLVPGEFTKDNQNRYLRTKLPVLKLFTDVDWKSNLKQTNYWLNRLKKIAESTFQGKLLFAIADKVHHAEDIAKFAITSFPGIGIEDAANSQRYRFNEEFSVANVIQFAKDFLEGKVKSYIKSEPTPVQDGPVTIVTGDNFKDIVLDPSKDVLLEMYAPWCGHCKSLEPVYNELATNLKSESNLVIAKMDATANDSPHGKYQAKGYPTILFSPANNHDNPVAYSGARDVKSFTDYLKKNAVAAFKSKSEL
jgi:protein disulfide isomerase family A protein 3